MKLYNVTGTYSRQIGEWERTGQIHSFLLSDYSATSEVEAERIAQTILQAGTLPEDQITFYVKAVAI